jgi:hypothetical protein
MNTESWAREVIAAGGDMPEHDRVTPFRQRESRPSKPWVVGVVLWTRAPLIGASPEDRIGGPIRFSLRPHAHPRTVEARHLSHHCFAWRAGVRDPAPASRAKR